jgi:hypothetical protein
VREPVKAVVERQPTIMVSKTCGYHRQATNQRRVVPRPPFFPATSSQRSWAQRSTTTEKHDREMKLNGSSAKAHCHRQAERCLPSSGRWVGSDVLSTSKKPQPVKRVAHQQQLSERQRLMQRQRSEAMKEHRSVLASKSKEQRKLFLENKPAMTSETSKISTIIPLDAFCTSSHRLPTRPISQRPSRRRNPPPKKLLNSQDDEIRGGHPKQSQKIAVLSVKNHPHKKAFTFDFDDVRRSYKNQLLKLLDEHPNVMPRAIAHITKRFPDWQCKSPDLEELLTQYSGHEEKLLKMMRFGIGKAEGEQWPGTTSRCG